VELERSGLAVLRSNWREGVRRDGTPFAYTCPCAGRYKHQWYWDSCFHAIVWSRFDPARARAELRTLLRAGRTDGFVPHTAFWGARLRLVDARGRPARAVCPRARRGSRRFVKLLVLTPEPVDGEMLRKVLGEDVSQAEVLVVSPAGHQSKIAFWVSDADEAIAEADAAQLETVERLDEQGIDAAGDTGESEPAVALQDALAAFPADRVVVFSHPEGDRDYREDEGLADAEKTLGVPVTHALIER
jgi:hypothetical protein